MSSFRSVSEWERIIRSSDFKRGNYKRVGDPVTRLIS